MRQSLVLTLKSTHRLAVDIAHHPGAGHIHSQDLNAQSQGPDMQDLRFLA